METTSLDNSIVQERLCPASSAGHDCSARCEQALQTRLRQTGCAHARSWSRWGETYASGAILRQCDLYSHRRGCTHWYRPPYTADADPTHRSAVLLGLLLFAEAEDASSLLGALATSFAAARACFWYGRQNAAHAWSRLWSRSGRTRYRDLAQWRQMSAILISQTQPCLRAYLCDAVDSDLEVPAPVYRPENVRESIRRYGRECCCIAELPRSSLSGPLVTSICPHQHWLCHGCISTAVSVVRGGSIGAGGV